MFFEVTKEGAERALLYEESYVWAVLEANGELCLCDLVKCSVGEIRDCFHADENKVRFYIQEE